MTTKKVVVVIGSPRKNGNSTILAKQVIAGAQTNGADVESFHLHDMNIQPCRACDTCQEDMSKDCVIDDDIKLIHPQLRGADALVVASPIYWFNVSAQTKLFIDRCYALGDPQGHALTGKRIGIILTYGDADPFISGAVNAIRAFQDSFNYIGAKIVGMVYGTALKAGEIESNRALMDKAYRLGKKLGLDT